MPVFSNKGVAIALLWTASTLSFAEACDEHLIAVAPITSDVVLCKGQFLLGYDVDQRIPDWVAYKLTKESVEKYHQRSDYFVADELVPQGGSAALSDYAGSGFDRGHLAPSASIDVSKEAMEQSFQLSNIAPQLPSLNRRGWKVMEAEVRDLAIEHGTVYVVSGTQGNYRQVGAALSDTKANKSGRIKVGGLPNLGLMLDGHVSIPAYFYKAIYVPSMNASGVYIIPHQGMDGRETKTYFFPLEKARRLLQLSLFESTDSSFIGY
jgi:endonuclease G